MLKLIRQNHNEPKLDELFSIIADLKDFLNEDVDFKNIQWTDNFNAIVDFQDDDGSFKLFDSYDVPTEARIDFCYIPTYVCSAILMKAYLSGEMHFTAKARNALQRGLENCCARNLRGHGFEALKEQIKSLNLFFKAGLREFLDLNHEFCPQFSEMIDSIKANFARMEAEGNFTGPWNESYEDEILAVNEYFSHRNVFVYGTLMKGETNHRYLENSRCLATTLIEGYDMYNVGWFPAIKAGDGMIIGELYRVSTDDIPAIDALEGEGSLYAKRCETLRDAEGRKTFAFVYVYLGDVSDLERIPAWKDYVWYVSYGSNMLLERFMCYIEGGAYGQSRYHPPCSDTTPPVAVKAIEIPHDMYFGNVSGSWHGSGVSFLDTASHGKALGVAYLITKEQFDHIVYEENSGRPQNKIYGWYEDTVSLAPIGGIEALTITNEDLRPYNEPSEEYLDSLFDGIRQNWPDMSDEEIGDYLKCCIR